MADEYDPTAPPTFDAAAVEDHEDSYDPASYGDHGGPQADANDEDDDYDPSSMNYGDDGAQSTPAQSKPQTPTQAETTAPKSQTKVAGFIVEESDDEPDTSAPAPSQVNGNTGAHSGLGAVAQSEAQDVSLNSAPHVDTAEASSSLNGFTVPVPASSSTPVAPEIILQQTAPPSGQEGKTVSAAASAQPTQQPTQQSIAPTPQPPAQQSSLPSIQAPPARLPHDKVGQLEDRIKDDPKGDIGAWYELINHYAAKEQYDNVRTVYRRFSEVFRTAVKLYQDWIKFESDLDRRHDVSVVVNTALAKEQIYHVALWKIYLDTVRREHPLVGDSTGANRNMHLAAFEATLGAIGIDPDAGELWREYVDFVKDGPGTLGGQGWQDLQKVDLVRKAYQRATKVPHSELVKLWKEYEAFEMSIHKQTGRKHVQEQSPHYMQARTARMQLEQKISGLDRTSLPRLPPIYGCAGEDEFGEQVEKWRSWIAWERDEDPLVYKGSEDEEWRKRVIYAYDQATIFLCFYPQIWFEAASWCFSTGIADVIARGDAFLEKGMQMNPESVLLAMMKADRIESDLEPGNTEEVLIRNGDKLDKPFADVHAALYALRNKAMDKDKVALAQIEAHFNSLPPEEEPQNAQEDDDDDIPAEKPLTRTEQKKAQIDAVKQASAAYLDMFKRMISYVWVAKMRAFRRVQGQGRAPKKNDEKPKPYVKGSRAIFSEARPGGPLSSEVYIAAALMEWQCYRDPSAIKIFERGMRLFPTDTAFILEYIKHLISTQDVTNARVVFESTIPKIMGSTELTHEQKQDSCRPLIGYMHDFESKYGDWAQIHKIEKRMAEIYPEEPEIARFAHRLELPTFDAINAQIIISPSQAQPKPVSSLPPGAAAQHIMAGQLAPSIEGPTSPRMGGAAPEILLGPNGPYVASPKRPLESDDDGPNRKFMRGESPLKNAPGVRLAATTTGSGKGGFATKTFVPVNGPPVPTGVSAPPPGLPPMPIGPPPLPVAVLNVLSIIPPVHTYIGTRLDPAKLIQLVTSVPIEQTRAAHQNGTLNLKFRPL
ncbi:hypothetical protein CBER1_00139 [Cercospora berteroae]|uniref:mRNA 3'-end-processing protein RNA14 n=1 Tax=Cercospora berteroae TaxID=357750 RepID=A0A2S6CDH3_9PEZI|nr:hypothetical protein CBER1_00139 [Cercospora berteroae]